MPRKPKTQVEPEAEAEVTGPRGPSLDHRGHCTICGLLGDHVHSTQPPKHAQKAKREPAPDPDEPSDEDEVLEVEFAPELLAAMAEAGEVEFVVEFDPGPAEPQEGGDYPEKDDAGEA